MCEGDQSLSWRGRMKTSVEVGGAGGRIPKVWLGAQDRGLHDLGDEVQELPLAAALEPEPDHRGEALEEHKHCHERKDTQEIQE